MDEREIDVLLTLASELHFRRTAERLHISTAAVSQTLARVVAEFQRMRPGCQVTITETSLNDMFGPLRRDEVDVSVLPLPAREDDLHVATVVFSEPAFVALPRTHSLAHRDALSSADLAGETALEVAGVPGYWRREWQLGTPNRAPQPTITGFQEMLALVGAGRGIAVVGAQSATYYPRPGLNYIPLVDGTPFEYAAVRRAGPAPAIVTDFLDFLPPPA